MDKCFSIHFPWKYNEKEAAWLLIFISLALIIFGPSDALQFSQLTEKDLDVHPALVKFWNPVLETVAYYPNLEELELVAKVYAYFAPLIIFEDNNLYML